MGVDYLGTEEYSKALTATLDDFWKALTHRWREEAVKALTSTTFAIPQGRGPLAWQPPAEAYGHLSGGSGEFCAYLKWVKDGQTGSYSACEGWNSLSQTYVECHADRILTQMENWAWEKRQEVAAAVPQLEGLDLGALHEAYTTFVQVGRGLCLEPGAAAETELPKLEGHPLADDVDWLSGNDRGKEWFADWTGLAADSVRDGFLASTRPTLRNQSALLGYLANLYSDRAAMIQLTRNNTLEWLKWAIKKLNEKQQVTEVVTTGLSEFLGVTSTTMSVVGLFSAAVKTASGPIGVAISVIGFLAEIVGKATTERDAMTLDDIFAGLDTEVRNLHGKLDDRETGYGIAADILQRELAGVHSYNLELYDLTQGHPHGSHGDPASSKGMKADVSFILDVAQRCYEASESYSVQLRAFAPTGNADRQLAGRGGVQSEGDLILVEIRDAVESFIQTSCARFLYAGDQIKAAAEAYAKSDQTQKQLLERKLADWKHDGVGRYDNGGDIDLNPATPEKETDPGDYAEGTERGKLEPETTGNPRGDEYEHEREVDGAGYLGKSDGQG